MKKEVLLFVAILFLLSCAVPETVIPEDEPSSMLEGEDPSSLDSKPPSYKVGIFYYPWYATPNFDGEWAHWAADGDQVFDPPMDISSDFYPVLGPYSSLDPEVVAQHFSWLREAGVGVILSSWWGREDQTEQAVPLLLEQAEKFGLKVGFHIEPHSGFNSKNLVEDVKYLVETYGTHPAFFRTKLSSLWSREKKPKALIFVWSVPSFEEADVEAWRNALDTIHAASDEVLLVADGGDPRWVTEGHFDGAYHYVATDFSWAEKMPEGSLYVPSVGPGFQSTRIAPEEGTNFGRKEGETYNLQWEAALGTTVEPPMVTITSFNEWHEGTQIEPAKPATNGKKYTYRDYGNLGENGYLKLTKEWVDKYRVGWGVEPPLTTTLEATEGNKRWVSADTHVHTDFCFQDHTPEDLVTLMSNNDVQIAATLVWAEGLYDNTYRKLVTGKDHPSSSAEAIVHYDAELSGHPGDDGGHVILLGLDSMNLPFIKSLEEDPKSSVLVVDWVAKNKPAVLMGMAHGGSFDEYELPYQGFESFQDGKSEQFNPVPEFPVNVVIAEKHGRPFFLNIETEEEEFLNLAGHHPVEDGGMILWTRLLNTGFKVPLARGSDFDCGGLDVGIPRTRVLIDGKVSYQGFLEGLGAGKTSVANNRHESVTMKINGMDVGSEVIADGPLKVAINVETVNSGTVELLVNGVVKETFPIQPGKNILDSSLQLDTSAWVTARTAKALAGAMYIIVDGQPIRSTEDACYFVRYIESLKQLRDTEDPEHPAYLGESLAETLALYDMAQAEFLRRFEEAGGTECS